MAAAAWSLWKLPSGELVGIPASGAEAHPRRPAADEDHALDAPGGFGVEREEGAEVGQRGEGEIGERAFVERGAEGGGGGGGFSQISRGSRAGEDVGIGDSGGAAEAGGHVAGDARGGGEAGVAVGRADATNADFGAVERLDQRETVVRLVQRHADGRVGVDPDVGHSTVSIQQKAEIVRRLRRRKLSADYADLRRLEEGEKKAFHSLLLPSEICVNLRNLRTILHFACG